MKIIQYIRLFLHLIVFQTFKSKAFIEADIIRWLEIYKIDKGILSGFVCLMASYPEFRNLFYNRVKINGGILHLLCPKRESLFIYTHEIGKGLFIKNGISTIINAKSIGENCWIEQQAMLIFKHKDDLPVIADNVTIHAGAKVMGDIIVGSYSIIKANAVVLKDVAPCSIVAGIPAVPVNQDMCAKSVII
jgi:serine O-acetyltransferase